MLPQAKTQQGLGGSPEARKKSGAGSAQGLQRGRGPANTLTLDSQLPNLHEKKFLLSPDTTLVPDVVPAWKVNADGGTGTGSSHDPIAAPPPPTSSPGSTPVLIPQAQRDAWPASRGLRVGEVWLAEAGSCGTDLLAPGQLCPVPFVLSPALLFFLLPRLPWGRGPCHCAPSVLLFARRQASPSSVQPVTSYLARWVRLWSLPPCHH